MSKKKYPTAKNVRLTVYVVLLVAVLALTWAVATLVSRSHPQLSPQSGHMRLVPLAPAR